jgi:ribosomal protein S18 acetylase RimI-like enzyme
VVDHARTLGLAEVQLNVWAFNGEAQALFTSLGFEPRSLRLSLDMRPDGSSPAGPPGADG